MLHLERRQRPAHTKGAHVKLHRSLRWIQREPAAFERLIHHACAHAIDDGIDARLPLHACCTGSRAHGGKPPSRAIISWVPSSFPHATASGSATL